MGILQCDDGNVMNGDGCSSDCSIELGFDCFGGNKQHPDTCKPLTAPKATLTATKTKTLLLQFSTQVKMPQSCKFTINNF